MNAIAKRGQKISSHQRDVICAISTGAEHSFRLFLFNKSTILMNFKVHCPICELVPNYLRLCQSLNDVNEKPLRAVECGCSIANGVPNCLLINKVALANFEGLSQDGRWAELSKTLSSSPFNDDLSIDTTF